ncbi:hypothetical protein HID58_054526 [Brassica napus]|uniref:Zinc knuckle CX2CX4HX4C domain-containing protein n=1 Tax=Brassica napus TaxID=3708 RepID=A0ABQ8AHS8_BRANA|nr:hypothetical protein HID58_054526 [Brassica napus]
MASLTIRPEPVKQKKRPNYQINNNRSAFDLTRFCSATGKKKRREGVGGEASDADRDSDAGGGAAALGFLQGGRGFRERESVLALGSHPQWCECVCKINGLLPLIKSFVIKYANRDEVTANFAYEKLEKHCSKCYRLDHDIKDCLEAKHEERAFKAQEDKTRREVTESEKIRTQPSGSNVLHFSATKQAETNQRDEKKFNRHAREYDERGDIEEIRSYSPRQEISQRRYDSEDPKYRNNVHRSQLSRSSHHREAYPSNCEVSSRPRDLRRELSDRHCSMDRSLQPSRSRDRMPARSEDSAPMEPRDSSNMGIPLEEIQNSVPAAVFNEDVNEVREAMIQYTQCDDPTENAAHRARMRRVEEEGEMEDTAALMIQASLTAPTNLPHPIDQPSSAEIVPTTLRLGPPAQTTVENAKEAPKETGKRKPGRPPGPVAERSLGRTQKINLSPT